MKYIIDHANINEIDEVLNMGIQAITANPTLYKKNTIDMLSFLDYYKDKNLSFLSAEVMGNTVEEMLSEVDAILKIYPKAIIKINFSKAGLKLCNILHNRGIKTAITLVFSIAQVAAAMNAHADYIFFFIGRNDEMGNDGLALIEDAIKLTKNSNTHIVAASLKNLHHLQALSKLDIEYVGIPYQLYMSSLQHPLTDSGKETFEKDWKDIRK
ncbi:transaldolase, partial [Breznakia sp. OttesenSCG-928-G09]|nr:transaldolase [Breznakia sp. OttesenSCG-928-G09]